EDPRLLVPETGQGLEPAEDLRTGRVPSGPQRGRVAAVLAHQRLTQRLDPPGHRPGVPVYRRWGGTERGELLWIGRRDRFGTELPQPLGDLGRSGKGRFHCYLLVEQHPYQ